MQSSVSQDREKYLGGSDIPVLLGISKYKTRWQLLKEKAELAPIAPVFINQAITYGNTMEPKIRDYLNIGRGPDDLFKEWKFEKAFKGSKLSARGHLDGYDAEHKTVLEIKTTGEFKGDNLRDYPEYLYQMLFYMIMPRPMLNDGILAVYLRPEDYNEVFDETRLRIFKFTRQQVQKEIKYLKSEIIRFLTDLEYIINNPEACEAKLMNVEISQASEKVLAFEAKIAELKEAETQYKELKEDLAELMTEYGVKTFNAGDYQITLVEGAPETIEKVKTCDIEALEMFYPEVAETCIKVTDKKKAGRRAAVRITKKKGKE